MAEYKYVGKSIPRIDAREKVTGQAMFTADYTLPRMLHCRILRSPHAHARITRIDTSKAEKAPGVRVVITARDTPPVRFSTTLEDQYPLPTDNLVRKVGDAVAAVVAETLDAAEEALQLIEVEYEDLPRCLNIDEGYSKNPPVVVHPELYSLQVNPPFRASFKWNPEAIKREGRPNLVQHFKVKTGDVDKGFTEADFVIENTFETVRAHHCMLEPHAFLCWTDANGVINVMASTQGMYFDRLTLARAYQTNEESFRMHSPWVGGGFGAKLGLREEHLIAIEASKRTGRPVKITLTRWESMLCTESRYNMRTRVKDGYKKDGTLVAREVEMLEDLGAYSGTGSLLVRSAIFGAVGSYRIPNFKLDSRGVYTNLPKSGQLRGVGSPDVQWAIENQMDIAAEQLGISPVEIRAKNILDRGDIDVTGTPVKSTAARECLDRVAKEIRLHEKSAHGPGPWKRGKGIAIGNKYTLPGLVSGATVKVFGEGMVEVRHNTCEMGQGTHSALAQIAAEEFDIPIERVRVVRGDSATTPYDLGTFASRGLYNTGNALLRACQDAKRQMFAIAAPILGVPAAELETKDFKIYRKGLSSVAISIADLFVPNRIVAKEGLEIIGKASYASPVVLEDESGHSERMSCYFSHIAYGVEVAIDEETGEVKLEKVAVAADMGQPINPKLCEGQIEGGMAMGAGLALYEKLEFDDKGRPLNPNFTDYRMPTVEQIPIGDSLKTLLVYDPFEEGPFGAKGVGELTSIAIEPAINNAIYNAIGVRIRELPITAEKILRALKEKGGGTKSPGGK